MDCKNRGSPTQPGSGTVTLGKDRDLRYRVRHQKKSNFRKGEPSTGQELLEAFKVAQRALGKHRAQEKRTFKKMALKKRDTEFDEFIFAEQQNYDSESPWRFTDLRSESHKRTWSLMWPQHEWIGFYSFVAQQHKLPWDRVNQNHVVEVHFKRSSEISLYDPWVAEMRLANNQPIVAEEQGVMDWVVPNVVKDNVERATSAVERVSLAAERIAQQSENVVEGVKDFFSENKTKIIASVGLALASLANAPSLITVVLECLKLIVNYTNFLNDIPTYVASIWPTIAKMYRWTLTSMGLQGSIEAPTAAIQQSDDEIASVVPDSKFWATAGALAAGIGALVGASVLVPDSLKVSEIATKAYHRATLNIATKRIQDGIEGFCDKVFDYAKRTLASLFPEGTFLSFFDEWLHESQVDITSFLSRVAKVTDPTKRDEILNLASTKKELDQLVVIANQIENGIATGKLEKKSAQVTLCRDSIRKLLSFVTFFVNAHQEEVRDTPFSVCFHSEPGVGKSIITKAVAHNLCDPEKGCSVDVNWENFLYFRSSCDKFYSNYRGQSCVIIDDWGQSRSSSPDNSEMRDFIAMISATPFSPPQADISDKGRPFNSKLIITTTNVPYPCPTEIAQPDAIYRRRNFMWEVVVVDKTLPLEDVYRYGFFRHNSDKLGRINEKPYDFEEMIYKMIPVFNAWNEKNQTIKAVGKIAFKKPPPKTEMRLGYGDTSARGIQQMEESQKSLYPRFYERNNWQRCELARILLAKNKMAAVSRDNHHLKSKALREAIELIDAWGVENYHVGIEQSRLRYGCPCCASTSCNYYQDWSVCCLVPGGDMLANGSRYLKERNETFQREEKPWRYLYCQETSTLYKYMVDETTNELYQGFSPQVYTIHNYWTWTEEVFVFFWKVWSWDFALFEEPDWDANPYDFETGSRGHFRDLMERWAQAEKEQKEKEAIAEAHEQWFSHIPMLEQGEDEIQQHEAELQQEAARAKDEEATFEKIFGNSNYGKATIFALKALIGIGIVWTGLKATRALYHLFGATKTSKPSIQTTIMETAEGHITKIVETFPPDMKDTVLSILSGTIATCSASAAMRVFTMEGGAAAYGEAKTIRAVARQNMKFARPVMKAVETELLKSCPPVFADAPLRREIAEAQGCSDSNGLDLVLNVLGPKACFTIERQKTGEEGTGFCRIKGFGIKGRLVAFPWHFVPKVPTVLECTLSLAKRTIPLSVDFRRAKRCMNGDQEMDLALIELDYGVESFRDISQHFIREEQLKKLHNFKSMMVKNQSEAGGYCITSDYIDTTSIISQGKTYSYGPSYAEQDKVLLDGYTYRLPTQRGDCGALLLALNPALQGRIFGFHVAGISSTELGMCAPLTFEVLNQNIQQHFPNLVFGQTQEPTIEHVSFDEEKIEKRTVNTYGEMEFAGVVNGQLAQRIPNRHDIVPSLLHDMVFPVKKGPSVLSPSDPRIDYTKTPEGYISPLDQGAKKYSVHPKPFPEDDVRMATTLIYRKLSAYKPSGMELRPLTEHETINGNEFARYTGMDMSTSPGMPYKNIRPAGSKGKHVFFQFDEETNSYKLDFTKNVYGINPAQRLLNDIKEWEEAAFENRDVPLHMNYENLKQETIGIEKIQSGKTRLFSCAPLSINMLFRKYFGAFIAMMNQNCTELPSSVGINPLGPDWTFLAKRLLTKGDSMIAGDYKEWDGKLMGAIMQAFVRDVVNPLYAKAARRMGVSEEQIEKENRARLRLIDYAIHTYTIMGNSLVLKHQGNPSGIPITSDLNSGANWVYILCAFFKLLRDHKAANPHCENCKEVLSTLAMIFLELAFYGDDHIISVAREARCFFNFNTVRDFFTSHGIGYTDALKRGGECPDYQKLSELSYLKRGFVEEEGRYLAPLEIDSIQDQVNWIKRGHDEVEATLQNVESAMGEFFMHGETQYNEAEMAITMHLEEIQDLGLLTTSKAFELPTFSFEQEKQKWLNQFY